MALRSIVLADDHRMIRESLKMLIRRRADFRVVGEAADGLELLESLAQGPSPDAVIVDLTMPRMGGLDVIREIRKTDPETRLLVLTVQREEELLCGAFLAGADGYLLKQELAAELFRALDTIFEGRAYVSPMMASEAPDTWMRAFVARRTARGSGTLSSLVHPVILSTLSRKPDRIKSADRITG